jgi:hypothetical protein
MSDRFVTGLTTGHDPINDWTMLEGKNVEVYHAGNLIDQGTVEAVTNDGLVLWLRQNGPAGRRLVQRDPETEVQCVPD